MRLSRNTTFLEQEVLSPSGRDQSSREPHQGSNHQPEYQDTGQAQNGVFSKLQHRRNVAQP